MSKEYTKEEMLEAYKAGWSNALNGVGSLSTDAAFREWLEGLRPKVEEPPRPDVDGRAIVNEYFRSKSVITDRRDDGC